MGHLNYDKRTKAQVTPAEWLGVGAQVGQLANVLSGRTDLIAYVGPGAGGPAPACYTPATAEVEVNIDVAFGKSIKPEDIGDLLDRSTQFMWPKAVGAIFHEALHARYSNWDFVTAHKALGDKAFRALLMLEEGRIEGHGIDTSPENAGFLRACALEIVLADIEQEQLADTDTAAAAHLAALTIARVDAGVLEDSDITAIADVISSKLGDETLAQLRDLWLTAQSHSNHTDISELYDVARKWVELVDKQAEENGETPGEDGAPSSGTSGEFIASAMEALADSADAAVLGSFEQLSDQQVAEEWRKEAQDRASAAKQELEHKREAAEVFGQGTGPMPESSTSSTLRETRKPTGAERAAAVKVAQMLEKAKYRERDETEIHSVLPPGRLRTRAMVQGAALKSKGVMTQAEPWRRTVRKHVDDPKLTIGVLVDISGSMADAMEPMAVTAWVMSEAAKRVQGKAAMVYFGECAFATLKPGQHLSDVMVYTAPDGTEKFNSAFKALDGGLNMLHGSGARILVVVSDGVYTNLESQAARKWLHACERAGVGVLWMTMKPGYSGADAICSGTKAVMVKGLRSPVDAATEVGQAAAKALTSVG